MQTTSVFFWFRIVSIPIVVLPVCRSPMISSRWPRPTFVIASIALMPVSSGSFTGWGPPLPRRARAPPRGLDPGQRLLGRLDRPAAVERIPERIDDAPEERLTDRHAC